MFNRMVLLHDGTVADVHEIREIVHTYNGDTIIYIYSTRTSDGHEVLTTLSFSQNTGLSFEAAETLVKEHEMFAEYRDPAQEMLDTLLPSLTDDQAITIPRAFPQWSSGIAYTTGHRVLHNDILYKCLQDHTSQSDWAPDVAASLWARLLTPVPDPENPDEPVDILEWEQPDSTNPYMTGDKVTHNGQTWVSDIDSNVWEPGVYGWSVVE